MDGDFEEIPGFRAGPVEGPVAGLDPVAASVGGGRVRSADSGEVDFRNPFAGLNAEVDLHFLAFAGFTAERSEAFAEFPPLICFVGTTIQDSLEKHHHNPPDFSGWNGFPHSCQAGYGRSDGKYFRK